MLDRLESQVFSRIKYGFSKSIKEKYPDLNFTTSDQSSTSPKFPTVYVHMMESPEVGETLEGTEIAGINALFKIEVTDNESNTRSDEVAREVLKIMKSMRFRAVGMPFHGNTGDTYRTISRYRRGTGDEDIL